MNEEIEIKVSVKNLGKAEEKLRKIARFVKAKDQKDEYFMPPNKDYFAEKPTKEYFRVRNEKGKGHINYSFCHYGKDGKLLKTDEYETDINDPETMSVILGKIGMIKKVIVEKHRKMFEYKDFEICLDEIKGLGFFVEVEAKKMMGSPEETKRKCYEILEEIGADWKDAPNMGYPDMVIRKEKIG
ncbi:MAG: class IV adenylate cyclase [Candidatus Woesearchaeota archaeon]|nr:class IV adenylate cyclase [Candidatus Woesearchaeota archaeon]